MPHKLFSMWWTCGVNTQKVSEITTSPYCDDNEKNTVTLPIPDILNLS
jgi:hypothetical protein